MSRVLYSGFSTYGERRRNFDGGIWLIVRRAVLTSWLLPVLLLTQTGCDTLAYYGQAIQGQWQILRAASPVQQQLRQAALDPHTRHQLLLSQRILQFAADELQLPSNGRYAEYAALPRDYVVWNVFAAAPDDLTGKHWCYPFVGCAPYRGYFKMAQAQAAAQRYQQQGLETYVGPVPAYSTLGWFKDPLLSTFVHWPEAELVQLLVHELAHSRVWVKNDVAFNESFASFVGEQGAEQWFATRGHPDVWAEHQRKSAQWLRFRSLLLLAKARLQVVYASSTESIELDKQQVLQSMRDCYQLHKAVLGAGRFDGLMLQLNNALLVSVGTYEDWKPVMRRLFIEADGRWPAFYSAVAALAEMSAEVRQQQLRQLLEASSAEQQVAHYRNNQGTHQVNCQAF